MGGGDHPDSLIFLLPLLPWQMAAGTALTTQHPALQLDVEGSLVLRELRLENRLPQQSGPVR